MTERRYALRLASARETTPVLSHTQYLPGRRAAPQRGGRAARSQGPAAAAAPRGLRRACRLSRQRSSGPPAPSAACTACRCAGRPLCWLAGSGLMPTLLGPGPHAATHGSPRLQGGGAAGPCGCRHHHCDRVSKAPRVRSAGSRAGYGTVLLAPTPAAASRGPLPPNKQRLPSAVARPRRRCGAAFRHPVKIGSLELLCAPLRAPRAALGARPLSRSPFLRARCPLD